MKKIGKKRMLAGLILLLFAVLTNIFIAFYRKPLSETATLSVTLKAENDFAVNVYYLTNTQEDAKEFVEDQKYAMTYRERDGEDTLTFSIPAAASRVRLDLGETKNELILSKITYAYRKTEVADSGFAFDEVKGTNDLQAEADGGKLTVETADGDPYLLFDVNEDAVLPQAEQHAKQVWLVKQIVMCLITDLTLLIYWLRWDSLMSIPREVIHNRRLILNLSKNDFKTRFAGSYLGIFWAFVNPVITILLYWFVFERALNAGTQTTKAGIAVPFVLWLIAGMVPWFYFSEAWTNGTNSLMEYSYLVKKVVFQISILPVVKIVSSLYVHAFFIGFTLLIYTAYGFFPTLYMLQMLYYSLCMIVLAMGLAYLCSALAVFFRDLTQIINILMQVFMWMTPIMWNIDAMVISPPVMLILKLNPMYYVVSGYRDALINNVWFWDRPELTVYFWFVAALIYGIGTTVFKKLKVHFADVL